MNGHELHLRLILKGIERFKLKEFNSSEVTYGTGTAFIAMEIVAYLWDDFVKKFGGGSSDCSDPKKMIFLFEVLLWLKQRGLFVCPELSHVFKELERFDHVNESCRLGGFKDLWLEKHHWIQANVPDALINRYKWPKHVPELILRLGFEAYVNALPREGKSESWMLCDILDDHLKKHLPKLVRETIDVSTDETKKARNSIKARDRKIKKFFGSDYQLFFKMVRMRKYSNILKSSNSKEFKTSVRPKGGIAQLSLQAMYFRSVGDEREPNPKDFSMYVFLRSFLLDGIEW